MKKRSLVLALACGAFALRVNAQTENPINLYGRVVVSVESVEAKGPTPVARRTRVEDRASMVGMKGQEDLGNGLKAFFQIETPFRADDSGTLFASRNSAVGLLGPFGTVLLGRWDSPMKAAMTAADPWSDLTLGDITAVGLRGGAFSLRLPSTVQWFSPKWNGLALRLAYVANEDRTATFNPYIASTSIAYSRGDYYLAYAYEVHDEVVLATAGQREKAHTVATKVSIGKANLSAMYAEYSLTGRKKQRGYFLAVDYVSGNHTFIASFQSAKGGGPVAAPVQIGGDCWAVGYKYEFTSRTFFLVEYASIDNSPVSLFNFGQGALPVPVGGLQLRGIAAGLRHNF